MQLQLWSFAVAAGYRMEQELGIVIVRSIV